MDYQADPGAATRRGLGPRPQWHQAPPSPRSLQVLVLLIALPVVLSLLVVRAAAFGPASGAAPSSDLAGSADAADGDGDRELQVRDRLLHVHAVHGPDHRDLLLQGEDDLQVHHGEDDLHDDHVHDLRDLREQNPKPKKTKPKKLDSDSVEAHAEDPGLQQQQQQQRQQQRQQIPATCNAEENAARARRMRCVVSEGGELRVVDRAVPEPKARQVLIKVHATALNRADLMQAAGKYPPPPGATDVLGLECAGVIAGQGPDCERKLEDGARVSALLEGGGYGEYVVVDERQVLLVPDDQTFTEAAAVPEVWLTAFQHLLLVAKAQPGETILVHAGASGVGTAAIQLAKHVFGVGKIYVTAGSQEKIDFCKSLGADGGFNYKEEDWAQGVLDVTDGAGVDILLDPIAYPYAEQNAKATARDGRWVVYGLMGGPPENGTMAPILQQILMKRIHLLGTTLRARAPEYKADLCKQFVDMTFDKFAAKTLRPVLDKKNFEGISSFSEAHEYMKSNQSMGKIIVSLL